MLMIGKDIKLLAAKDVSVDEILCFYVENRQFLEPYEPKRSDEFYTKEYQERVRFSDIHSEWDKSSVRFYIWHERSEKIIGVITLANIVYGAFLSCHLGYKLHKDFLNQGYMTEAVGLVKDFAFNELKLHRIEANVMPSNMASLRVLEKSGFQKEGISKNYLKINGKWEDHIHMVLLNEAV